MVNFKPEQIVDDVVYFNSDNSDAWEASFGPDIATGSIASEPSTFTKS